MTSRGFFKPDFFPCILNRILSIHRKSDNLLWGTTEHFVRIRCLVSYFVTSHTHEIEHEQAKEQHGWQWFESSPGFWVAYKREKKASTMLKRILRKCSTVDQRPLHYFSSTYRDVWLRKCWGDKTTFFPIVSQVVYRILKARKYLKWKLFSIPHSK